MGWPEIFLTVNLAIQLIFVGTMPNQIIQSVDQYFDAKQSETQLSLPQRIHIEDNRSLIKQYSIHIVYGILLYYLVAMWGTFKGHKSIILTYTTINLVLCTGMLWNFIWELALNQYSGDIVQTITIILYFAIVSFYSYRCAKNAGLRKQHLTSQSNTLTIRYAQGSNKSNTKEKGKFAMDEEEMCTYSPNLETKVLMDPKSYV